MRSALVTMCAGIAAGLLDEGEAVQPRPKSTPYRGLGLTSAKKRHDPVPPHAGPLAGDSIPHCRASSNNRLRSLRL